MLSHFRPGGRETQGHNHKESLHPCHALEIDPLTLASRGNSERARCNSERGNREARLPTVAINRSGIEATDPSRLIHKQEGITSSKRSSIGVAAIGNQRRDKRYLIAGPRDVTELLESLYCSNSSRSNPRNFVEAKNV